MSKFQPDWSQWSEPQLLCLVALDFAVPLHQTHLTKRFKVRQQTRQSLIDAGLIRMVNLADVALPMLAAMPFLCLTREGLAVKRDYVRWVRDVGQKIGSLPASMQAVADTPL